MDTPPGPEPSAARRPPAGPGSRTTRKHALTLEGRMLRESAVESILQLIARFERFEHLSSLRFLCARVDTMFALGYVQEVPARRSDIGVEWEIVPGARSLHPWFVHACATLIDDFLGGVLGSRRAQRALSSECVAWSLLQCMSYSLWVSARSVIGLHRGWTDVVAGNEPKWFLRRLRQMHASIVVPAEYAAEFSEARIKARYDAYSQQILEIAEESGDD